MTVRRLPFDELFAMNQQLEQENKRLNDELLRRAAKDDDAENMMDLINNLDRKIGLLRDRLDYIRNQARLELDVMEASGGLTGFALRIQQLATFTDADYHD